MATLTPLDTAPSKLLVHSVCWRDDAVLKRDLLDLAMMTPPKELLRTAIAKAQVSYGDSVEDPVKAVEALTQRPHRLDRCMADMGMDTLSKAALWKRIRALVS